MLGQWLASPGWLILATLAGFFAATGLMLHWLSFAGGERPRWLGLTGIVPPFLTGPMLLFGLMTGFLANDAWEQTRQATRAVLAERDGAMAVETLALALPSSQEKLLSLTRAYVTAVLDDEWTIDDERGAQSVRAALEALIQEVARPAIAQEAGSSVQSALLNAVSRIATARSSRLALQTDDADDFKWSAVLCLGVLAQAGIAAVHMERARAQAGALLLFTLSAVVMLTLIAVCERPFDGSNQISAAPLRAVLPP